MCACCLIGGDDTKESSATSAQARIRAKNLVGAGGVQLQNEKGVILQLAGAKVGVEVSAAVGGVTITLK